MKIYSTTYNTNFASIAKAKPPLSVPSGKMVCFQIPFPSEGFLERLIVYQATGTAVDFSVELLNSQIPYPPGQYNTGTAATDALEPYRIQIPTGPLEADAGTVMTLLDDDFGQSFRNCDGGWTLNQRYVYLVISPVGAGGTTTWNVMIQCRTDVG